MDRAGVNASFWMTSPLQPTYPELFEDSRTDAVIVGAGITGLTAAMRLVEAGLKVQVIEMNWVGSGTTGSSTGHLDSYTDETLKGLIRGLGEDHARIALVAKQQAIDVIEDWDRRLQLGCRFRRVPAYLYCEDDADIEMLKVEYTLVRNLGIAVDMQRQAPLPFDTALSLVFPDQGRFDPLAYIQGLARKIVEAGGQIFENTRAEKIWEENGQGRVETNRGTITADAVILAGHAPLLGMFTVEPRALPYQSYVLGVRVLNDVPDALYWDTARPYHYIRRATDDDPRL
ncbi:MAG TPA: FAD-dependent oxidoreductase, partial [Phycisphaerae bacterium]|nr:FAD-dependent oxidoreductase [Phycisphaerae bacterium]